MSKLAELFENEAVRDFGVALRKALRIGEDYSSLVELEYAETKEQFAEVIKRFLRRYETLAKKGYKGKQLKRPREESLVELMRLVDEHGVKLVRSALISYALTTEESLGKTLKGLVKKYRFDLVYSTLNKLKEQTEEGEENE